MKSEELLLNCIDDIESGRYSLEECVARHPEIGTELRQVIGLISQIDRTNLTPSPEFKLRARNRLQRVMAETERREAKVGPRFWLGYRLSYATTAAAIVIALLGGTSVYASRDTLPTDTLYPVKTGVEKVQLALKLDPQAKANFQIELADRRVQEIVAESARGQAISSATLNAVGSQIDSAMDSIGKLAPEQAKVFAEQVSQMAATQESTLQTVASAAPQAAQPALKQAIDIARRSNLIAETAVSNPSFLATRASVRDDKLESTHFEIEGTLEGVDNDTWKVGGVQLANVKTERNAPEVGNTIKVTGIVRNNQTYISKVEDQGKAPGQLIVKGIYSGSSDDGKTWQIGGVSVEGMSNTPPPSAGSHLEVRAPSDNGKRSVQPEKSLDEGALNAGGVNRDQGQSGNNRTPNQDATNQDQGRDSQSGGQQNTGNQGQGQNQGGSREQNGGNGNRGGDSRGQSSGGSQGQNTGSQGQNSGNQGQSTGGQDGGKGSGDSGKGGSADSGKGGSADSGKGGSGDSGKGSGGGDNGKGGNQEGGKGGSQDSGKGSGGSDGSRGSSHDGSGYGSRDSGGQQSSGDRN